jgi:hypothetical protein
MKRLVVIITFALLFMSAGKSEAGCYGRYFHPCYFHCGIRPVVACRVYHRAQVPGFWQWSWRFHRYFWIHGYWY